MENLGERFTMPPATSQNGSEPSTTAKRLAYATTRAEVLFGCYRRGDANDPDRYVTSIAAVLTLYDEDLIRQVTDPRTGISTTEKFRAFMPNSGELKAYCDEQAAIRHRVRAYAAMPKPNFRGDRIAGPPRNRANLLVHKTAARYQEMVNKTEKADALDWRWDETGRGIWVPYSWW